MTSHNFIGNRGRGERLGKDGKGARGRSTETIEQKRREERK